MLSEATATFNSRAKKLECQLERGEATAKARWDEERPRIEKRIAGGWFIQQDTGTGFGPAFSQPVFALVMA